MDSALLARVEKQAWFHRFPRGLPIVVFFFALAATLLSVMAIERADAEADRLELERNATEVVTALQRRASENIAYLSAAAAFFAANDNVTSADFADFSKLLIADHDERGTLGMGWAQRVFANDAAAFEERQRQQLTVDYEIGRASCRERG